MASRRTGAASGQGGDRRVDKEASDEIKEKWEAALKMARALKGAERAEAVANAFSLIDGMDISQAPWESLGAGERGLAAWERTDHTLAHCAAERGIPEALEELARRGANMSAVARSRNGLTPLGCACIGASAACVEKLLELGADPNARDAGRETPMHDAARHGQWACCEALAKAGGMVDARQDEGLTPFLCAVRALARADELGEPQRAVLEGLISLGADWRAVDNEGVGALQMACHPDSGLNEGLAKFLLALGADPNAKGESGQPILKELCFSKDTSAGVIAALLLQSGADPAPALRLAGDERLNRAVWGAAQARAEQLEIERASAPTPKAGRRAGL